MKTTLNLLIIYICVLLFSCTNKEHKVDIEAISYTVITDSIYSRMPGTLLISKDYLIWQDPFTTNSFMNIIDLESGHHVYSIGTIGQGPEEFNTPVISKAYNNSIFVFDLNTNHQALYSLDSIATGQKPYLKYNDNQDELITEKIQISENQFVVVQPSKEHKLKLITERDIVEFGHSMIDDKDASNLYDINQGRVQYNESNNKLVFSSYLFPYLEIYDIKNNKADLSFHSKIDKSLYTKSGDEIRANKSRNGNMSMSLSKDYIITIQRDYESDNTDESTVGMDFYKLPRTLFLYDYDGNLKRIVDVGIPIFRIASSIENNDVYAIGVNPEFTIIKVEL